VLGDIINTVEQAKGSAPFNWSAATPQQISAYLSSKGITLSGEFSRGLGQLEGGAKAGSDPSSARYDGMALGAKGDWSSPAGQAYMRDYAMQQGLPWAANNPELLRLGPAAIKVLADVHLSQQTYDGLTKEAAFRAKDVVTVAKFAKETNTDPNDLGNTLKQNNRALATDENGKVDQKVLESLRDAQTEYMAAPNKPGAKEKLLKTFKSYMDKPAKKPPAEEILRVLQVQTGKELDQKQKTENAATTMQNAATTTQNDLNAFDSAEPPPASVPKPRVDAIPATDRRTRGSKLDARDAGAVKDGKTSNKTTVAAASAPKAKPLSPGAAT
jgi:hypothetical protein